MKPSKEEYILPHDIDDDDFITGDVNNDSTSESDSDDESDEGEGNNEPMEVIHSILKRSQVYTVI